jgi:hypothetical protein
VILCYSGTMKLANLSTLVSKNKQAGVCCHLQPVVSLGCNPIIGTPPSQVCIVYCIYNGLSSYQGLSPRRDSNPQAKLAKVRCAPTAEGAFAL